MVCVRRWPLEGYCQWWIVIDPRRPSCRETAGVCASSFCQRQMLLTEEIQKKPNNNPFSQEAERLSSATKLAAMWSHALMQQISHSSPSVYRMFTASMPVWNDNQTHAAEGRSRNYSPAEMKSGLTVSCSLAGFMKSSPGLCLGRGIVWPEMGHWCHPCQGYCGRLWLRAIMECKHCYIIHIYSEINHSWGIGDVQMTFPLNV